MVERICREDILIVNRHGDAASGNLLLRQFDSENLVIGERKFLYDNHIAVSVHERLGLFQHHFRLQLDYLTVGSLMHLLVGELDAQFVNVEANIGTVIHREIEEEVVTDRIDVVQAHLELMLLGADIAVLRRRVPYFADKAIHILG